MFTREQLYSDQGHKKTKSLFKEVSQHPEHVIMTLSHKVEGLPCLREIYMDLASDDPTEYGFAIHVFGEWDHWERITKSGFMTSYLDEWRKEVEVKRKAKAFQCVIKEVEEGGRSSFTAAKYLIEEPWKDKKAETKRKVKATAEKAFKPFNDDVASLKEKGLLQ